MRAQIPLLLLLTLSARAMAQAVERAAAPTTGPTTRASTGPTTSPDPLSEPMRVTLRLDNVPAVDAFAQLANAAEMRWGGVPESVAETLKDRRVTATFSREPLLPALVELCKQAKAEPVMQRIGGTAPILSLRIPREFAPGVPLNQAPLLPTWTQCPTVSTGPVLFAVTTASTSASRSLTPQPQQQQPPPVVEVPNLSYHVMMLTEPKLDVVGYVPFPRLIEARDEVGAAIPLPVRNQRPDYIDARGEALGFSINCRCPENARTISLVRGTMHVRVATRRENLSVPVALNLPEDVASKDYSLGGARLHLIHLKKLGDEYDFRYALQRDAMGETDWRRVTSDPEWMRPQLVDGDGIPLYSINTTEQRPGDQIISNRRLSQTSRTPGPTRGEPARVVWSVPVATEEVEIPFEFHDLPVPR